MVEVSESDTKNCGEGHTQMPAANEADEILPDLLVQGAPESQDDSLAV